MSWECWWPNFERLKGVSGWKSILDCGFDDFLVVERETFFGSDIKFGVGKLTGGFLFVKVSTPHDDGAAFVGWFDGHVLTTAKWFECRPLIGIDIGEFDRLAEIKFSNIVPAFSNEKVDGTKFAFGWSPIRFAFVEGFEFVFFCVSRVVVVVVLSYLACNSAFQVNMRQADAEYCSWHFKWWSRIRQYLK